MKTLIIFILANTLLCCIPALAQHGSYGAGRGSSAPHGAPPSNSNPSDLSGFAHALAAQADDDQITAFTSLLRLTDTALQQLQDARTVSSGGSLVPASKAAPLKESIENSRSQTEAFFKSFSPRQKTELKALVKPINKSQSEIAKAWESFQRTLTAGGSPTDRAQAADKLRTHLENLRDDQKKLASEMNVPVPAS